MAAAGAPSGSITSRTRASKSVAGNANILASSEIMMRLAAQREVPTALGRTWHGIRC